MLCSYLHIHTYTMSSQTNTIEWKHLKCSVSREFVGGRAVRTVLNRVSGRSCAQLTAVIGPSGCGKSLLLNCLSGRLPRSRSTEFTGSILVNGTSASSGELALCSRYVSSARTTYCLTSLCGRRCASPHSSPFPTRRPDKPLGKRSTHLALEEYKTQW